ncbi:MAG: YHS domain-containing (seleno)protein [Psychromonas sp.]
MPEKNSEIFYIKPWSIRKLHKCIRGKLMRKFTYFLKTILLFMFFSINSAQAEDQIYTGYFNNKAAAGYDVVAYFSEQKPVKGDSDFSYEYQGADWYFSNQENLDKFKQNPEYFAPQYGGYCAWAMAGNKTAPGNPPFWTIYNDKLYLNYDQDVVDTWRDNKDEFIEQADVHWASLEKD